MAEQHGTHCPAGAVVRSLADGIRSDAARVTFVQSEAVRELVTSWVGPRYDRRLYRSFTTVS
jgi:hypothetical protein